MNEPAAIPPVQTATPVSAATSGEELVCAFNGLRSQLVSTLFFLLGNYEDAQDVAQDVFLKCWRTRQELNGIQNVRAWIYRVGVNAAKDLQRNAWRRRARPLSGSMALIEGDSLSPVEAAQERETQERLRIALMDLRIEEKEVFLLRQNGGLTYEEIAALRQSPVGTVKTQMRSALLKLRAVLQEKTSD
jgi:RNA polymerase sigma-70 factor (ECF subfamily)